MVLAALYCPHNETELKQNSFETVSKQFRFIVRTVSHDEDAVVV